MIAAPRVLHSSSTDPVSPPGLPRAVAAALAALALGSASLLVGCNTPRQPPVLYPQVQPGPASDARPTRVLVLPAGCGSVERPCPQSYITAVDAIVRSGLEFVGLNLVESETLLAQTRQRHEEQRTKTTNSETSSTTTMESPLGFDNTVTRNTTSTSTENERFVVLDGPTFEDMALAERQALLAQSGADAVLSVRIVIGGTIGVWAPNQNVEVLIKLGVSQGDAMAWASRCIASSNDFTTVDAALEAAARCAIYGGTGRQPHPPQ